MSRPNCAILWFRQDLRLSDHPALIAAFASGLPILCLYILEEEASLRPLGGASRWRLDRALAALESQILARGGKLHFLRGAAEELLPRLAAAANAQQIFWTRRYGGAEIALDARLKQAFAAQNIAARSFDGALLAEPWTVKTGAGGPYKVFTPFWRALRENFLDAPPLAAPPAWRDAIWPVEGPVAVTLKNLALAPQTPDWAKNFPNPLAGSGGAAQRLNAFLDQKLDAYAENRDRLDLDATSGLASALHFGEISPREIFHAAAARQNADKFLSELGWREFSHHLLYHWPDLPMRAFNPRFDGFGWRDDPVALAAWKRGETGYPLVDAAMRQLWTTGDMHNRARMAVASFLTKHLLIDWREGEKWFWDTLCDADAANNAASWQWVAGCGADAAPYFRIFNPVLQGEKFDPDGGYVKKHLPALAELPAKYVYRPWTAPAAVLARAGVKLGETYPFPIVDHAFARSRALDALAALPN